MVDLTLEEKEARQRKARSTKAKAVENRRQVMRLRVIAAMTFVEIGDQLDISPQAAHKLYWQEVKAQNKITSDLAAQAHEDELRRLARASAKVGLMIENGNLLAVDRMLKIEERRRKILGNEPPDKTALTDPTGKLPYSPAARDMTEDEREARIKEMEKMRGERK